jgi:hypothetical protein
MRCGCVARVVTAALQLLRVGKVQMAVVVLEGLLRSAQHKPTRAKPAPRAGKAGARA